ncbi:hypothetical protein L484_021120 [Morus notabilis]|uniref:Uncharacterized protein n=1 Tax=Morus notabilis TaxID=981085 RepID=W9RPZ4_9ROSA|nr:hypothetical protein L484_021120 [Morus notabilis]
MGDEDKGMGAQERLPEREIFYKFRERSMGVDLMVKSTMMRDGERRVLSPTVCLTVPKKKPMVFEQSRRRMGRSLFEEASLELREDYMLHVEIGFEIQSEDINAEKVKRRDNMKFAT